MRIRIRNTVLNIVKKIHDVFRGNPSKGVPVPVTGNYWFMQVISSVQKRLKIQMFTGGPRSKIFNCSFG